MERKKMKIAKSMKLLAIVVLGTTIMSAQATRTWVSGVGDDANPCSRTAPCKTFAGAISKTAAGGEIDALDPGGFGALTITKAITLDGGGGQVASILVSGTNGIVVAAGANDVVTIRNLRFDGLQGGPSGAGLTGINFISGKDLNVENCIIFGFSTSGVSASLGASGSVHVVNTIIKNIGSCVPASCLTGQGDGIFAQTTAGTVQVGIDHSQIMVTSNNGVEGGQNSRVAVNRSFVEHAGANGLKASDGTSANAQMTIENSESDYNTNGVTAGTGASVSVGGSKLSFNSGCGLNAAGGGMFTFVQGANGTNRGHSNAGGNTCGTVSPAAQF